MLRYAFLLREFVRRDVQGRYAGSMLGFFWSLVQPAFQLALFSFVFSVVLKIRLGGEPTDNFAVFLFCGLMPWLAFQEGLQRSTTAITDNAPLVKKIHFPAEILVLSVVISAVLHQAVASLLFLAVLVWMGLLEVSGFPLLAVALPLQVALTLGLGLFGAAIHTFFRDFGQFLIMLLTGWFYLTPIVYPASALPERLEPLLAWNPMSALVDLYRQAFLGGRLAEVEYLPIAFAWAATAMFAGLWLFRRLKPAFADEL
ncbi:MAG: ABC transporter permease [Acidobacteriota bacterium]